MKNGRIDKKLKIQLGLYIRKPGKKSLTQKKFILMRGFAFEKYGPCSKNAQRKGGKNIKNTQNGKKSLFEVRFEFLRCLFGGFGGGFGI